MANAKTDCGLSLCPLFDDLYFFFSQSLQLIHKSVDLLICRFNLALDSRLRVVRLRFR